MIGKHTHLLSAGFCDKKGDATMRKLRWMEFGVVLILIVVLAVLGMNWARQRRIRTELQACHNNLRAWHTVFRMYAAESPGNLYPPIMLKADLSNRMSTIFDQRPDLVTHNRFIPSPRGAAIYPDYLTDHALLFCPSAAYFDMGQFAALVGDTLDADDLFSPSYGYYGYLTPAYPDWAFLLAAFNLVPHDIEAWRVRSWADSPIELESELEIPFLYTYIQANAFGPPFGAPFVGENLHTSVDSEAAKAHRIHPYTVITKDWSAAPPDTGELAQWMEQPHRHRFHRLQVGGHRLLEPALTLSESEVPVMWDLCAMPAPGMFMLNHMPGGSNVLFLDGHVEFVAFQERFPMLGEVASLNSISDAMPASSPWF